MGRVRIRKRTRNAAIVAVGALLLLVALLASLRDRGSVDLLSSARGLIDRGDLAGALESLDKALELAEASPQRPGREDTLSEIRALRGACNQQLGRPRSAREDFREARILKPGQPELWQREGVALLKLERFREAAEHFEQTGKEFPDLERDMRYAAGCAWYEQSESERTECLDQVLPRLSLDAQFGAEDSIGRFAAGRIEEPDLLRGLPLLKGDTGQAALSSLRASREHFLRAADLLHDYSRYEKIEPLSGETYARILFRLGRIYDARLLIETLIALSESLPGATKRAESTERLFLLLANELYTRKIYGEAGSTFLALRRSLMQARDFTGARNARMFAVESFLRAGQGAKALAEIGTEASSSDQVLPLFYLGLALVQTGREAEAYAPIGRAVETLRKREFSAALEWYRDEDHRHWILVELANILEKADRRENYRQILRAAAALEPQEVSWSRRLADDMDRSRFDRREVAKQRLKTLQRPGATREDFENWRAAERAAWNGVRSLEQEVVLKSQRVRQKYVEGEISRSSKTISPPASSMILGNAKSKRASAYDVALANLRDSGTVLLAELNKSPFLALEVYEHLLQEGDREQAYLVLLGLQAIEPDVVAFGRLLADHEYANGTSERAALLFQELAQVDPRDSDSAWLAWSLLRQSGLEGAAESFEEQMLQLAPQGSGRVVVALRSLEQGDAETAEAIGLAASLEDPCVAASRSLAALALARDSRARAALDLALDVLERWPKEPLGMLAAMEAERALGKPSQEAFDRQEAALRNLPAALLAALGHSLHSRGEHELAVHVLRLALERDPSHVPARADRIDSLLALGQVAEAVSELDALESTPGSGDLLRRAIATLLRSGPEPCYEILKTRSDQDLSQLSMHRWICLLSAYLGRMTTALRLVEEGVELSDEDLRFVALQVVLHAEASPPPAKLPKLLRARVASLYQIQPTGGEPSEVRDRELERWVSIELADRNSGALSAALLRVLLVRDRPEWRDLERSQEARLLNRYPDLGERSLLQAQHFFDEGRAPLAVSVLRRHLDADPDDEAAFAQLARWTDHLDEETLVQVRGLAENAGLTGYAALFSGLWNLLDGRDEQARSDLLHARSLLKDSAPAVHGLLDLEQLAVFERRVSPLTGSPVQQWYRDARVEEVSAPYEFALHGALRESPGNASFLERIQRFAVERGSPFALSERLQIDLVVGLVENPVPNWPLFQTVTELARTQAGDSDPLLRLGVALRTAVRLTNGTTDTRELRRTIVPLASSLREHGALAASEALLDISAKETPYAPDILRERALSARVRGDERAAYTLLERATICGLADPEISTWLAQRRLDERGEVGEARRWCQLALDSIAPSTPAKVEADAWSLMARILYVEGDQLESVRAWTHAADAMGIAVDDLEFHARQIFLAGRPKRAREALRAAIESSPESSALLARLLQQLGPETEVETN